MTDDDAPYRLPDADTHPAIIAERVMRMPEHQHLVDNEIEIDWLMRTREKIKGGRRDPTGEKCLCIIPG